MKVGDLVMKRAYGRTWENKALPMKVVTRVIKSHEPRLHGRAPYYITFEDDPGKWENPNDYYIVSEA